MRSRPMFNLQLSFNYFEYPPFKDAWRWLRPRRFWETAPLVPAVFHGKQSLIKFSGGDVRTAGRSISHPRLRFLSHISQTGDWCASIRRSQTYLPADNSAERGRYYVSQSQLIAMESWLTRLSGGHRTAWIDFRRRSGTIPLRKTLIQMKIKSLNCSSCPWIHGFFFFFFSLNCLWWKCASHRFQAYDTPEDGVLCQHNSITELVVVVSWCSRNAGCHFFIPADCHLT